nr:hypothetical protein [uncultured Acetatifactor sp.]
MDEKTIIMEQERLAREKKRRRNRKKKRLAGAAAAAMLTVGAWYVGWGRNITVQTNQTSVQVTAQSGQEIVYATLTEVKGNEITYMVQEEAFGINEGPGAYEEEGQEQTTLIPVGTDVITRLGATVTFSRLATGDNVALIMEEDEGQKVIVKVYILN